MGFAVVEWWIAGVFCSFATFLTFHQIYEHLQKNTSHHLRRYIIRIIAMVPIYGWSSWLGLRFPFLAIYFNLVRECYEAFVIYSFFVLLVQYLGGEENLIFLLACKTENISHPFPFCCFHTWKNADRDSMPVEWQTRIDEERARIAEFKEKEKHQEELHSVVDDSSTSLVTTSNGDMLQYTISLDSANVSKSYPTYQNGETKNVTIKVDEGISSSSGNAPSPLDRPTLSRQVSLTRQPSVDSPALYSSFAYHTHLGTLQYCVLIPITAMITFVLQLTDNFHEGEFKADAGYPYISFVINWSQIWAMYCLILFYMNLKDELAPIHPVGKFLVVKAVVFFTFWQAVGIEALAYFDILAAEDADTWQNFVICLEMLVAALVHKVFFSYEHFHDPLAPAINAPILRQIIDAIDVTDVYVHDIQRMRRKAKVRNMVKKNKKRKQMRDRDAALSPSSSDLGVGLDTFNRQQRDMKQSLLDSDTSEQPDDESESANDEETGDEKYDGDSEELTKHVSLSDISPSDHHIVITGKLQNASSFGPLSSLNPNTPVRVDVYRSSISHQRQ